MGFKSLVAVKRGISVATATLGTSVDVSIPNTLPFSAIVIKNTQGSLSGGSTGTIVANAIIANLRLYVAGKCIWDFTSDLDANKPLTANILNRQMNRLKNGVADTAEFTIITLPDRIEVGHNAYLTITLNTLTNMQTAGGDRTALAGGSIDVMVALEDTLPNKKIGSLVSGGKFATAANTGVLSYFLNPSELGFKCSNIIFYLEDSGSASSTAIDRITLKKGNEEIFNGTIADIQEANRLKYGLAPETGYFVIPVNRVIGANDLSLILEKGTAGTAVDLHYQMRLVKAF